jgi:HK97 family phage major capsid protein
MPGTTVTPLPASLADWSPKQIRDARFERKQRADEIAHAVGPNCENATAEHLAELRQVNDEIERLDQAGTLDTSSRALRGLAARGRLDMSDGRQRDGASLGDAFVAGIRQQRGLDVSGFNVPLMAELDGPVGGTTVPPFYDSTVRFLPSRRRFLRSLIPTTPIDTSSVRYTQQSVQTQAAAVVAAHGVKPTSVYSVEQVTAPVKVIAHVSQPMDRSVISDYPALGAFLDFQLREGVLLAEEDYILNDATAGILHQSGLQTQAAGTMAAPDAVRYAITKVELKNVEPDAAVFHPNDWQDIATLTTIDGQYIWGAPADNEPQTIWGLPVFTSSVIAEGTGLVGAFGLGAQLWDREQAQVRYFETGLSATAGHDLAISNEILFRGEERIAFGVPFPGFFCSVTGI